MMWALVVLALAGGFGLGWKLRKPEVIQHTKYVRQPTPEPVVLLEPATRELVSEVDVVSYDIEPSRVTPSKCGTATRIVLGDSTRTVLE